MLYFIWHQILKVLNHNNNSEDNLLLFTPVFLYLTKVSFNPKPSMKNMLRMTKSPGYSSHFLRLKNPYLPGVKAAQLITTVLATSMAEQLYTLSLCFVIFRYFDITLAISQYLNCNIYIFQNVIDYYHTCDVLTLQLWYFYFLDYIL